MYCSPEEISQALEKFRAYRIAANRPVLEKIIPVIEATQPPNPSDGRDYQKLRKEFLEDVLQSGPLDIDKPSELLERWDDFKYIVDGTAVDPDEARRTTRRNAFFSAVETGLEEKSPEGVRESINAPPELRLLAEQVDAVWGPGLAEWMCMFHGEFFNLYDDRRVNSPEIQRDVPYGPIFDDAETCEEFETAIGFQLGDGMELECWAILSRHRDHSDQPWEWRYMINCFEHGFRVFDTIPDTLSCFASLREPGESGMDYWDSIIGDRVYEHLRVGSYRS
ncbi:hypothetical protein O1611_g10039 [Lasiodiplodia mahajangana]|uniref:Uncharacterized protein n=1 Tax=Lasiodiplodia mahajangana TaxID=1108764 RepID=A0ACC2J2I3_9PEZI|nr:hypothetical protein O1611_g10039 [Lasiodiplodia mahajangana]